MTQGLFRDNRQWLDEQFIGQQALLNSLASRCHYDKKGIDARITSLLERMDEFEKQNEVLAGKLEAAMEHISELDDSLGKARAAFAELKSGVQK